MAFAFSAEDKKQAAPKEPEVVLERVPPTSPEKALETIEVAEGFRVEQVAAEPLVVDPVAMTFDEHGRLYVVEMVDYSERGKDWLGRVRLLADEDGDGRFEKSQVFAEELSWPTAVICYDGGIFVGNAPHILYLKDTNGDSFADADETRLVFSGFGRGNVQGLINSFQWGLDNRIHGSASSAGGRIKTHGVKRPPLDLSGRDFAFDPKTLEIEANTGGGQHGMTFNRWGDRFVCHNSDHLQAIVFEERYLARNPFQPIASARRSIAADGPQAEVYRASPVEAWRVARTKLRLEGKAEGPVEGGGRAAGYFTSGTGIAVYEGGLWNAGDGDNGGLVYVADVGSNLVHRKRLAPEGVTYRGERIDKNTEFVRSTDIWFRPVQMAIGPEGALYVADMYREVIEHPLSLPPQLKQQLDLNSGNDRGRIYRVVPANYSYSPPAPLAGASTAELVKALDHENIWRRMTASRLLYERQDPAAIPLLRLQLATSERPEGCIATLYALRGAGGLTAKDVLGALDDPHSQVRRQALRLSEPLMDSSPELLEKVLSLATDADPVIHFQLALSLGECSDARATRALADIVIRNPSQQDIVNAALTSIGERAGDFLLHLLSDRKWLSDPTAKRMLTAIVSQIARQRRDNDLAALVEVLKTSSGQMSENGVALLLKALTRLPAKALAGDSPHLAELRRLRQSAAQNLVRDARRVLTRNDASEEQRLAAIESLALGEFAKQRELLDELLAPHELPAIRSAVLAACAGFSAPQVAEMVLARWQEFSPTERKQATELLLRREPWALALLKYLEADKLPLTTLDPAHVARLENYPGKEARKLARKLRGQTPEDRQKVFEEYRKVALAGGDASRGKVVFEKNCATCHQLSGVGETVGPNLAAMVSRGAESVLFNILAPSREVDPRFLEYVLTTVDGQVLTGLIAAETSTAVTLRNAENKTETVLRADIEGMHTTGKSLMPEGFEKLIDKPAMADLLTYLQENAADSATEGASK